MSITPGFPFSPHIPFVQTHKLGAVAFEKQIDFAGGAISVFGDDQFRQVVGRGVRGFVIIIAVHYSRKISKKCVIKKKKYQKNV